MVAAHRPLSARFACALVALGVALSRGCAAPTGVPSVPARVEPPAAASAPEEAPPRNEDLAARIDGRKAPLPFARARFDGDFLWIDLAAVPLSCLGDVPERADVISFPLPPGPAGDFYRGTPIGLRAEVKTESRASGWPWITVNVERAEATSDAWIEAKITAHDHSPRTEDYLVHDTDLGGSFRARVCDQAIAPTLGRSFDEPELFEFARAFAELAVDPVTGEKSIEEITFSTDPRARCGDTANPGFTLSELSGARSRAPVIGKARPATPSYYVRDADDMCPGTAFGIPGGPRAAVTFDALSFVPGGKIRGSVELAAFIPILKGSRAPGRFVATVCPAR